MEPRLVLLLILAVCLTGCRRHSFHADGFVASQGDRINTWNSAPQGCTRDPFDGLPPKDTSSILTLLWVNPGLRNPTLDNRDTAPDAPMRLEFSHAETRDAPESGPVVATLHTLRHPGIRLDKRVCTALNLQAREVAPDSSEARPLLAGSLTLDCQAEKNHITATVSFERCKF